MSFASSVDLAGLNGSNGFRLEGVSAGDNAGYSVASAGDVNGDGFADIILGAYQADVDGRSNAGASYVIFGTANGFAAKLPLSSLNGSNGFRLEGALANDNAGRAVASAGDVNGDGFDDIIIGANGAAGGAGRTYVVFGASGFSSSLNLDGLNGRNGFRLDGASAGDWSGFAVASAGDVNGDGLADVVIGAPAGPGRNTVFGGASYVVFGASGGFAPSLNLSALNGVNGFRLEGAGSFGQAGISVASAGDVNGDGFADVILGSPLSDLSSVVFGAAGGFAPSIALSALNGSNGFRLVGPASLGGDQTGISVATAGDVNGDGFADVIIGASEAGTNGRNFAGRAYVVFGASAGFASAVNLGTLNGSDGFRLNGVAASDRAGQSVAAAGDVNGDGFGDFLVAAPSANGVGATYVVFGTAAGSASAFELSALNGSNGFRLNGVSVLDNYFSASVATAGDVDGDGFPDLIIGAGNASPNGARDAGAASLYFSPATGGATYRGTSLADTLRGTPDADRMNGYGQNDRLFGNAGDDTITGGAGNDSITGGAGNDAIDGGPGQDTAIFSAPLDQHRYGLRDGVMIISGPDGTDQLRNLELAQFGSAAAVSLASLRGGDADNGLFYARLGTTAAEYVLGRGGFFGLKNQFQAGAGSDVVLGTPRSDSIDGGAGDDAIDGGEGADVLRGGPGSSFLAGGSGRDQFSIEAQAGNPSWSTITDWEAGESLQIRGYQAGRLNFIWVANDGAQGYRGATFHADLDGDGVIDVSVTWAGMTQNLLPTPRFETDSIFFD